MVKISAAAWVLFVSLALGEMSRAEPARHAASTSVVLKGGTLIDGTGAKAKKADVAIRGDRIVAVGSVAIEPGARVIDVTGQVVAPGFIDLHTHSDEGIAKPKLRANVNYTTQGVATVVTGNCGSGVLDAAKYLATIDAQGAGTNVIHLIPHGRVRHAVLGNAPRPPDAAELVRMSAIVDRAMRAGAWGLSTGLIYVPSRYAETAELVALSRVVARYGGIYASHIRDEGSGLLGSVDEAIAIGREARLPVHISHLKASGRQNWGLAGPACQRIVDARAAGQVVTADQYPYVASSTQLASMVIPDWALRGNTEDFVRIAADPTRGAALRREIQEALDDRDHGASIRIAKFSPRPSRVGRDLVSIAVQEGTTPLEVVLDIQRHGGAQAINFGMDESEVRAIMRHDFVATCSDGSTHLPGSGDKPHPRAYGSFPRKIRYALDDKVLSLEAAIRSCSGLPAAILGLTERGVIRQGHFADVVVFDPAKFRDTATFDHPTRYAPGVSFLFVNGVPVIEDGKPTKELPGRALRPSSDGPPDVILEFGRIWTGDREHPWAEAVASRAGAIVAVGSREDMLRLRGPKTRLVDRPDAFAMPGLIDAHGHLADLGASLEEIDLRGVDRPEEAARRVRVWIDAHPGNSWITGQNWDQSLWPGGDFPTAAVLDQVAPDRPVWLVRVDGHAGWANSAAMRLAKVSSASQAPPNGRILRDPAGHPTGVFIDGAKPLVTHAIPRATRADFARQIVGGQSLVLKAGLTGVHDAGVPASEVEAYRDLDHAGKLKLRVYGMGSVSSGEESSLVGHAPIAPKPGARFELRAIKIFIDGAMGSRGGLLFEPYSDDPGNSGLSLFDPKRLEAVATEALRHGWQVATHAIGDRGNAQVLDAYAAARAAVPEVKDPRLRIEHAQVVRRQDVERFVRLGVVASMQPSHAIDDMRWADARLGPERVQGAYAWRWFLDAGVHMAFGSDFPVEVENPFYGIYAAVTREDANGNPPGGWHPDQKMSLEETLRAFTAGSAYAAFAEDRLGVLRPGMRADLTVVDRDLFKVAPREILTTRVVMTIVDGEVLYERREP